MLLEIFPWFGLVAFVLLWTHTILGVFEPWLRRRINVDAYVHWTAVIILICIILHPLLLLIGIKFHVSLFNGPGLRYILLGLIGWVLLITYDIGKVLKRYNFFVRNWQNVLRISTIGFILIFFHSLYLGEHLQSGFLRHVWIFLGVTAIASAIYTYVVKRFLK